MTDIKPLIEHLEAISKLKILSGANQFSIGAYDKAAKLIRENHDNPTSLSGIGVKTAKTISQFLSTGTSEAYQELAAQYPVECLELCIVRGIGPKKAYKLWQNGVKSLDTMIVLAENDKLQGLEALKIGIDKTAKTSILFARDMKAGRLPYETAAFIGRKVIEALNSVKEISKLELCGSLRRKRSTIKDLDVLVCVKKKETVIYDRCIEGLEGGGIGVETLNRGDRKASLIVLDSFGTKMPCDIWLIEDWHWGAALNYATGSKEHNIKLREMAKGKGLMVNEYGIYRDKERIGGESEEDLYRILGIDYVLPEA